MSVLGWHHTGSLEAIRGPQRKSQTGRWKARRISRDPWVREQGLGAGLRGPVLAWCQTSVSARVLVGVATLLPEV